MEWFGREVSVQAAVKDQGAPRQFIEFELAGSGTFERLECKLVDEEGARVWWVLTPSVVLEE